MQLKTITFSPVDSTVNANVYLDAVQLKGTTTINFVLTAFDSDSNDIIQTIVIYGDGMQQVYNADVSKSTFIQPITSVSHVYYSQYSSYMTLLSAVFQIVYTNLAVVNVIQPFTMLQSSYYQEIGHLHLTTTQLLPVSSNDALFVCYDDYSNLHNFAVHVG